MKITNESKKMIIMLRDAGAKFKKPVVLTDDIIIERALYAMFLTLQMPNEDQVKVTEMMKKVKESLDRLRKTNH